MRRQITAVYRDKDDIGKLDKNLYPYAIQSIVLGTPLRNIRGRINENVILIDITEDELPSLLRQALRNTMVQTRGRFKVYTS